MCSIASYLRHYWHDISSVQVRLDWFWGFIAAILLLLSNVLQISLFRYFLDHNGLSLGFVAAWRTLCIQLTGKYIPGKLVGVAALSYALKEAGLSGPHAIATVFVFNVVALLSNLLVGLLTLPAWASHADPVCIGLFVGGAIASSVAVCTHGFWRLINYALTRFKRPLLPGYPSRTAMLNLMLGWILYWLVLGAGMFAATHFLIEVPLKWFPLMVPAFSLACFISNISFLAPAGFGVREALLITLVGAGSTKALGAVFAAASRLAMLVDDAVMIGGAWLLAPRLEKHSPSRITSIQPDGTGEK
jgi:hypothetical protein